MVNVKRAKIIAKTYSNMKKKVGIGIAYGLAFILLPISFILWVLNFRFLNVSHFHSIGHLTTEPDCYIKECVLNKKKRKKEIIVCPTKKTFFYYPKFICCNEDLVDLWKQHFFVIKSPYLAFLCKILRLCKFLDKDVSHYVQSYLKNMQFYKINYHWKSHPTVSLSDSFLEKGKKALSLLGVDKNAPFIVFANRDSSYRNCKDYFSCRNNDINDYCLALIELIKEGYYCIRLGHPKSLPLNSDLLMGYEKYVIDYTRSQIVSGWLDLYLIAHSKMFLSGSSGLSTLATLFQIPLVLVGQVPLCHFPPRYCDLSLPKMYIDIASGKEIPFKKILDSKIGYLIHDYEFQQYGIMLKDNTPQEILMTVKEQLHSLKQKTYTKTELQYHFESLIPSHNYAFPMAARISNFFLERYEFLL